MKMMKSIPYLPVHNMEAAVTFYEATLHFSCRHKEPKFSILFRDDVEILLWSATDEAWKTRDTRMKSGPIVSGAESFLAGTASCRIEVSEVDALLQDYQEKGALYSADTKVEKKPWGTREFVDVF